MTIENTNTTADPDVVFGAEGTVPNPQFAGGAELLERLGTKPEAWAAEFVRLAAEDNDCNAADGRAGGWVFEWIAAALEAAREEGRNGPYVRSTARLHELVASVAAAAGGVKSEAKQAEAVDRVLEEFGVPTPDRG